MNHVLVTVVRNTKSVVVNSTLLSDIIIFAYKIIISLQRKLVNVVIDNI